MKPVRKKMRLADWDYSEEGTYFLTLCAKNRKSLFSRIVGRGILDAPEVQLTEIGLVIQNTLCYLVEKHPEMMFHRWVIMPNHVHILLSLSKSRKTAGGASGKPRPTDAVVPKLVSSLKRFTNRQTAVNIWQDGYYDHIVRDEQDFLVRWQYIDNNPAAWLDDDYYVD